MVLVSPVSTQTFPVVVAALSIKPEKIVLLSTPKVGKFEKFLQNVLEYAGIEVEVRNISPYDRSSILSAISGVPGDSLFLLNCGTKFTAMVIFDAVGRDRAIYYTPDSKVLSLNGKTLFHVKSDILDVETHSAMYGFKIKSEVQEIRKILERKPLTCHIAFNYRKYIPVLNRIQGQFLSENVLPANFYNLALKHKVVERRGGKYLIIEDGYLRGKWLEEFVFLKLIEENFYDVHIGVVINWYDSGVVNEVDVVAVKNNRLHLFSCKTGKNINTFGKHLYELHELTKRIGGDFGKGYLCVASHALTTTRPTKKLYPSIPDKPFNPEDRQWKQFLNSPEGISYRKARSAYTSFKNLRKRARLMEIDVLTVEDLFVKNWR